MLQMQESMNWDIAGSFIESWQHYYFRKAKIVNQFFYGLVETAV